MFTPGAGNANRMVNERGPRYCVIGTIRRDEFYVTYSDTAKGAEQWREHAEESGYRNIQVYPPEGSIDLTALGRARTEARRKFDEATAILRAGVLRALEEGRAEAEIARQANVDRMTVRSWAGK